MKKFKVEGTISRKSRGAYLINHDLPKDPFISNKKLNGALHGDKVRVKVQITEKGFDGRVDKIIEKHNGPFLCKLQEFRETRAWAIPKYNIGTDIFLPSKQRGEAKDGDVCLVEIEERVFEKAPIGRIVKNYGQEGNHRMEMEVIFDQYNLDKDFPKEVLDEANQISSEITQEELDKRWDFRNINTIVIDPENSKDADDALGMEFIDNGIRVYVFIADVTHYIKEGSELDKWAMAKGNSTYLVDRVFHMLPTNLSTKVCSLNPGEDKLAFAYIFDIANDGQIINEQYGRCVINVNHKYTYEEAQKIIEGESDTYETIVRTLNDYAKILKQFRTSIYFREKEVFFKLHDGEVKDVIIKTTKDSNRLIEEYMLLANRKSSEFMAKKLEGSDQDMIFRVHEEPEYERLEELRNLISEFGYEFDLGSIRESLKRLSSEIKGKPEENMIGELMVRTMQKAQYSTQALGHYGLGFKFYGHYTSPIRRYFDQRVTRMLCEILGNSGYPK